jgi:hypothetical protein
VDWRPKSLPDTWAQPAFSGVKLTVLFVVMNVAIAVVLWWAFRKASGSGLQATDATVQKPSPDPWKEADTKPEQQVVTGSAPEA